METHGGQNQRMRQNDFLGARNARDARDTGQAHRERHAARRLVGVIMMFLLVWTLLGFNRIFVERIFIFDRRISESAEGMQAFYSHDPHISHLTVMCYRGVSNRGLRMFSPGRDDIYNFYCKFRTGFLPAQEHRYSVMKSLLEDIAAYRPVEQMSEGMRSFWNILQGQLGLATDTGPEEAPALRLSLSGQNTGKDRAVSIYLRNAEQKIDVSFMSFMKKKKIPTLVVPMRTQIPADLWRFLSMRRPLRNAEYAAAFSAFGIDFSGSTKGSEVPLLFFLALIEYGDFEAFNVLDANSIVFSQKICMVFIDKYLTVCTDSVLNCKTFLLPEHETFEKTVFLEVLKLGENLLKINTAIDYIVEKCYKFSFPVVGRLLETVIRKVLSMKKYTRQISAYQDLLSVVRSYLNLRIMINAYSDIKSQENTHAEEELHRQKNMEDLMKNAFFAQLYKNAFLARRRDFRLKDQIIPREITVDIHRHSSTLYSIKIHELSVSIPLEKWDFYLLLQRSTTFSILDADITFRNKSTSKVRTLADIKSVLQNFSRIHIPTKVAEITEPTVFEDGSKLELVGCTGNSSKFLDFL